MKRQSRKKLYSTLALAMAVGALTPVVVAEKASAAEPNPASDFMYTVEETGVKLTAYTGATKDIVIPSTIEGKPVTTLGGSLFLGKQLTSVSIPNTVTSIGTSTFANNLLTSVVIPDSVASIGSAAFSNNQLTDVKLPNGLLVIGTNAFTQNKLTTVTIPDSVVTINARAFYSNQLTSIIIPSGVAIINNDAFANNQLVSATILGNAVSYPSTNNVFGGNSPSLVLKSSLGSTTQDYATKYSLNFEEYKEPNAPSDPQPISQNLNGVLESGDFRLGISDVLNFGKVTLEAKPKTIKTGYTGSFSIIDARGTQEGWKLTVSATPFTEVAPVGGFADGTSAHILPRGTLALDTLTLSRVGTGSGGDPTTLLASTTVIDDGTVNVANAQIGSGMGEFNLSFSLDALAMTVDATTTRVDKVNYPETSTPYSSTITWDLVSAP